MSARFETQAEPIPGYRLLERLGSGGFGEVWKAEAPGGIFKAIKIIFGDIRSQDTDSSRFAEQELKALKRVKQVRHPYLLALDRYDIVDGRLMIVMELADCNLWDRFRECRKRNLPGIPREELLRYMAEASEVLDLMNDQFQLQHLDIKPQNLFLLYNHVKVADFGQVKDLEGMVASVTGGITPVYAAPETFDGFVSRFCDQYSLACVYQELLTGIRPFDGNSMQQLLMQHLQQAPNLNPAPYTDRAALSKALAKKPDERFPSCSALIQALINSGEPLTARGSSMSFAVPNLAPPAVPIPPAPPAPPVNSVTGPAAVAPKSDPTVSDRIEVFLTNRPVDPKSSSANGSASSANPPAKPAPAAAPPASAGVPAQPARTSSGSGVSALAASRHLENLPPIKTSSGSMGWPQPRPAGPSSNAKSSSALGGLPPLVAPGSAGPFPPASSIVPLGEMTPPPRSGTIDSTMPAERTAPPLQTGPGPLRPAVVIGIGYTGLRILQRLNRELTDRFGTPNRRPVVRMVYIDTDPDAITGATIDRPLGGRAGLPADAVFPAKLNRAGHYLKPRLNGRTLIEGWFDQQLLYRLPRNPVTMGLRIFGRLAFCDHYRALMQKLQAEIDTALSPESMMITREATGLELRTNQPRIYIACGLGGGTGSGMFLDVAYAIRARLKRIGYANPDMVGVFLLPPDRQVGEIDPLAQANTYASLTELHHYARPESVYAANFDDRGGSITDPDPAFSQVYLLPGLTPKPPGANNPGASVAAPNRSSIPPMRSEIGLQSTSRSTPVRPWAPTPGNLPNPETREGDDEDRIDPCATVASFLRLDLFSSFGPVSDDVRGPRKPGSRENCVVRTFGMNRFSWPRGEVISRASRSVTRQMVIRWVSPDPTRVRQVIPGWASERWSRLGLDPERLVAHFRASSDKLVGRKVEEAITSFVEPMIPKGWLGRLPDSDQLSVVLDQIRSLLGRPNPPAGSPPAELERALSDAANSAAEVATVDATQLVLELVEDPGFRPAGAEEAARQLLTVLDRTKSQFEQQVTELETASGFAYQTLIGYVHYQKGMRKPTAADITDALKSYPRSQYQALVYRAVVHLYHALREPLLETLNRISNCRAKVETLVEQFPVDDLAPVGPPLGPWDLLPVGCPSPESAAERFLGSLTQDDTIAIEHRVQAGFEREFGGLFQACLNSTEGPDTLVRVIREETRGYLDERLGEVDLAGMMLRRFGSTSGVGMGILRAFQNALPGLVANGPWSRGEIPVFACPVGEGGEPIRQAAAAVLPPATGDSGVPDEVVVYREYPEVPLSAFPQLGPTWSTAYRAAPDAQQCPPHARLDVDHWIDVDSV